TSVRSSEGNAAMILMLSVRLAATGHAYLDAYAPTNILIRSLRAPDGQRMAVPVSAMLAVAYGMAGAGLTSLIEYGGSGWLNPLVILCAWNTIKFGWVSVASAACSARRIVAHPLRSRRRAKVHGA
ncbi:MAG: hypothetical protein L0H93_23625, partial [Nocardioides sp.]|nr:hypothetical protein [Nocardioides sp.]